MFTGQKITSTNIFLASIDYNDGILKEELYSPQNSLYFNHTLPVLSTEFKQITPNINSTSFCNQFLSC